MKKLMVLVGLLGLAACAGPAPDVVEVTRTVTRIVTPPALEAEAVETCTMADCQDTLTIVLDDPQPAFTAVLTLNGVVETAVCQDGAWQHSQLPCDTWSLPLTGEPADVTLTLRRDDELLLDETLPVTYKTVHPNGPHCEPECRAGIVSVTMPAYP